MSIFNTKGNWDIFKGRLKQKLARITDDEIQFVKGKEDELKGQILKRAHEAKENILPKPTMGTCSACNGGV